MNQNNKVRSQGKVPFSWENKPGVCKETTIQEGTEFEVDQKAIRVSIQAIKIPPPPCGLHPPTRTSSRRGLKKSDHDDDPFLAAYKECTKSIGKGKLAKKDKRGMFSFSCKQSCSVRDDNLVKISQLHPEKDRSGLEM
ncbi:hypothetical protein PTKIN_Ptkin01aG0059000 [Pterospermum kingtungense]